MKISVEYKMEATRYEGMNVPQLRLLINNRGIVIGGAHTKPELIELLVAHDKNTRPGTVKSPPKLPVQQTRVPPVRVPVPTMPTTIKSPPKIPTTQTRIPVIPITQGRIPVVPVVPIQKVPVPNQTTNVTPIVIPRIPSPPWKQTIKIASPPKFTSVGPNTNVVPKFPTFQPPTQPLTMITPEMGIRNKLQKAQFGIYDFIWKRGIAQGPQLGITKNFATVFNDYQRIEIYRGEKYMIEYLMGHVTLQRVADLVDELGFHALNDTVDVYYNLLWYLNVASAPYASGLNAQEKEYISGLTPDQLVNLLGPKYKGPRDKASLMFAVLSGKSASRPDIGDIPRYPVVSEYSPSVVWILARDLYGLIDDENHIFGLYPPYVHVALQPPSAIEQVVVGTTEMNVDENMNRFGIILPTQDIPQTPANKLKYFLQEIAHYDPIFTRSQNLIPPPLLTGKTKEQALATLAPYTLKEIVDAYEPTGVWKNRKKLVKVVREEGRGGSQWAWRHRWCNNDNTMNILMAESHGEQDKDDPTDPTLSYGVQKNYRCYQMSELAGVWREDPEDHIFHFRVPDYLPADPKIGRPVMIDPTTGAPLLRDFPIESIRQLRILLRTPPQGFSIQPLIAKVDEGINAANNANVLMRRLKLEYDGKEETAKYITRLYLAWLFTYGMWMRFWKGPGTRWPTEWIDGGGKGDRCETGRRDEHIFIQQSIRTAITEAYENIPTLKQWIEALPLIDYNFLTGEVQVATAGTTTIKGILDEIQLGDFCMAHGSDLVLRTAYYLIVRILNFTTTAEFNTFITEMIPALFDIERQVVTYQLNKIKDKKGERGRALEARVLELGKAIPQQPPFDPLAVDRTGHTDPGIGQRIRFGEGQGREFN